MMERFDGTNIQTAGELFAELLRTDIVIVMSPEHLVTMGNNPDLRM